MNIRTRHLLAVALATALASPIVAAQEATGVVDANGNANAAIDAASQDTPPRNVVEPDPALPPQVNPVESAQQAADPRVPVAEDATDAIGAAPPPPPVEARGAAQAAGHADVVQRSVWADLDDDGDGRVSRDEGEVDAGFANGFDMMDADHDGFVSDVEFRTHAKAGHDAGQAPDDWGVERSASHSAASQRGIWTELDADGDGRISADEGGVDADFGANFEMMDADSDGFVTDAEFRTGARMERGTSDDGMDDDGTGDDGAARDADDRMDGGDGRDVDRDDHNEAVEPDPMNDRDGMDDDGTGMDDEDGGG